MPISSKHKLPHPYMPANHSKYLPLDILTTPRPYTYRLHKYRLRRTTQHKLQFESDYTKRVTDTPSISALGNRTHNLIVRRHLRKKRFDRDILAHWQCEKAVSRPVTDTEFGQPVNYVDWEKEIVHNDTDDMVHASRDVRTTELIRSIFNSEYWESQIIYDERDLPGFKTYVTINVNDPNLILEKIDTKKGRKTRPDTRRNNYNISNDRYYETHSVKSNLGNLGMQHALPALKLDSRIFKCCLSRDELRNFHRPHSTFLGCERLRISRMCHRSVRQNIKSLHQLTLADGTAFALFEYSEEIPLLVQNRGMVSLLTTYYKNNGSVPRKYVGKLTSIENEEASPFIVDIKPGVVVCALTNNLFKACVFRHAVADYLLIVTDNEVDEDSDNISDTKEHSTGTRRTRDVDSLQPVHSTRRTSRDVDDLQPVHGTRRIKDVDGTRRTARNSKPAKTVKCHIRKIANTFTVGQTFPLEEVYSPHSRKLNIFCKNRLKAAVFREYQARGLVTATYIEDIFPQFSEGSKRKWLREYSDSYKRGKETYYQLKKGVGMMNEEELRALVSPENVCQYESMMAAEQRLRDCGLEYRENVMEEGELLLMPWNLSRNFISFVNGRGILEMKGSGDPTGMGEGWSFVKSNVRIEEPELIWDREQRALSSTRDITYDEVKPLMDAREQRQHETVARPMAVPATTYILITRTINGVDETEKVSDPLVIKAYLKQRKKARIDERKSAAKNILHCGSCGGAGHMKTNKACPNFCVRTLRGTSTVKKAKNLLADIISKTIQQCVSMNYSSAFLRPVSVKKFPDYPKFVSDPMDIGTMKNKTRNHRYRTYQAFADDLKKMWTNCIAYNGPEHGLSKLAQTMYELAVSTMESRQDEIKEIEDIISKNEP